MIADEEDDPLLVKHRAKRNKVSAESAADQSSETATIKKLHVSSANLQKVSKKLCDGTIMCSKLCKAVLGLFKVIPSFFFLFAKIVLKQIMQSFPSSFVVYEEHWTYGPT